MTTKCAAVGYLALCALGLLVGCSTSSTGLADAAMDATIDQQPVSPDLQQTEGFSADLSDRPDAADAAPTDDPPEPCTPPEQPAPSPGRCEARAAVTCDAKTSIMIRQPCADATCVVYPIEEHPDDGSLGRTFDWAACIPSGAEPCSWEWTGARWKAKEPPACEGNVRTRCVLPPIPKYHFTFSPRPGSQVGYVLEEPCAIDELCTAGITVGTLRCLKNGTPLCDKVGSWCEGDERVGCEHVYEAREDCAASGQRCYPGCPGDHAFCDLPGSTSCDPTTHVPTCGSAKSYTACQACITHTVDCSTCTRLVGGQLTKVPCQCAMVESRLMPGGRYPQCIDAALTLCDPASATESCVGAVARQCLGYWREIDCSSLGKVCGASGGRAGCRAPDAPTCDVTNDATCDGNELVRCCPSSGIVAFGVDTVIDCVPGYEVRQDCGAVGPPGMFSCLTLGGGHAECNL